MDFEIDTIDIDRIGRTMNNPKWKESSGILKEFIDLKKNPINIENSQIMQVSSDRAKQRLNEKNVSFFIKAL